MRTLVSHFVNRLNPSVRFVKHCSFFFIILEGPNTALQQLNTPSEKLFLIILRGQGLVVEVLVLELAIDVVTDRMALSAVSVHEDNLLQVVAQIFIQKGVDVEVLPPSESVLKHDKGVLHFELTSSEKLEENDVSPVILKERDAPDGNLLVL